MPKNKSAKPALERVQLPQTSFISPGAMSKAIGVDMARLAVIAGVDCNAFREPQSMVVQETLSDIIGAISMAEALCGDTDRAFKWFSTERFAHHGNLTPAELWVKGERAAVLGFLADIEHGAND